MGVGYLKVGVFAEKFKMVYRDVYETRESVKQKEELLSHENWVLLCEIGS